MQKRLISLFWIKSSMDGSIHLPSRTTKLKLFFQETFSSSPPYSEQPRSQGGWNQSEELDKGPLFFVPVDSCWGVCRWSLWTHLRVAPHYCSLAPWDANLGPWAVQSAASRPSHRSAAASQVLWEVSVQASSIPSLPPCTRHHHPQPLAREIQLSSASFGVKPSKPSISETVQLNLPQLVWTETDYFPFQGIENTKADLEEEKKVFYFFFQWRIQQEGWVISQWYSMFHKVALYSSPTFLGDSIWGGKTKIQIHRGCCFWFILTRSSSTCWVRNRLSVSGTTELRLECMGGIRLSFFSPEEWASSSLPLKRITAA